MRDYFEYDWKLPKDRIPSPDCNVCLFRDSLPDDVPCLICCHNDDTPCGGLPISEE